MKSRLGVTLALTAILSLGGTALAKTTGAARPQNANTAGTMSGSSHKSHKARHRKHHRRARAHRKAAAAANANR